MVLPRLADDQEVFTGRQRDAVSESQAIDDDGGRPRPGFILEEPAMRPRLEHIQIPFVESKLVACVTEVDGPVG